MLKKLVLIMAASVFSAGVCVAVEAVRVPARDGDTADTLPVTDMERKMEIYLKSPGFVKIFEESEKSMRYLSLLDLMEIRVACREESRTKARSLKRDAMCRKLRRYEMLQNRAVALEAGVVRCDSKDVHCALSQARSILAILRNYEQMERVWYRLQIMIGTGALDE